MNLNIKNTSHQHFDQFVKLKLKIEEKNGCACSFMLKG